MKRINIFFLQVKDGKEVQQIINNPLPVRFYENLIWWNLFQVSGGDWGGVRAVNKRQEDMIKRKFDFHSIFPGEWWVGEGQQIIDNPNDSKKDLVKIFPIE